MRQFVLTVEQSVLQSLCTADGPILYADPVDAATIGAVNDFLWDTSVTTWDMLAPAIALAKGQKRIVIDADSTGGSAHITTGAWPGITDVVFLAGGADPDDVVLIADQGASFPGANSIDLDGVLLVTGQTSGALITTVAGSELVFRVRNGAALGNLGAGAPSLVNVTDNSGVEFFGLDRANAASNVFQLAGAASSVSFFMVGFCIIGNGSVFGGVGTVTIVCDGSSALQCSSAQTATTVNFTVQGGDGMKRPVALVNDSSLPGAAVMTDVGNGMNFTFTPFTAQALVRIVATLGMTGGVAGTLAEALMAVRVALSPGQTGGVNPQTSSVKVDAAAGRGTLVYEAVLSGMIPGLQNSVAVFAQWANTTAGTTLVCTAGTDPGEFAMTMTIEDYQG